MKPEKIRLSMDVTPELKARLDDLQKRSYATTTIEVFKKSLALYDLVLNQYETKGRIVLENDDGTREVLRLL
jgi:hypothetical protein